MPDSPPAEPALMGLFERLFRERRAPLAVARSAASPADWQVLYANEAFCRLTGQAWPALRGRSFGAVAAFRSDPSPGPAGRLEGGVELTAAGEREPGQAKMLAVPLLDDGGLARFQVIRLDWPSAPAGAPRPDPQDGPARLLDAVAAGVVVHRNFHPLYANLACARLLGLASPAALLAEPTLLRFLPLSSLERAVARHDAVLSGPPAPPPQIACGLTGDGEPFWAEVSEARFEWDGEAAAAMTLVDAGDHVRARTSETLLREAVDNLSDSFILYDGDDRVVLTNRSFHRIFGFLPPQDRIVGKPMVEILRTSVDNGAVVDPALRPDNKEEWIAQFIAGRRGQRPVLRENAWPDGRWDLVKEQRLASGGFVSVRTDITDRKRGEFALKDQEMRLRRELAERTNHLEAVLANIAQGVVVLSPDLRVVLTNPGLHEIVGYPPELGRPGTHVEALIRDRLNHGLFLPGEEESGDDIETIVARRLQAYRDLTRESFQHPFPNGRQVEIRREKLPDGMIICTFTDVTERMKAERELGQQREALYQREKLSALGMLLAGVAHELNNPLSVVLGQAALMESLGPDKAQRERAARIRKAAERCAKIIKTFLSMARGAPASRAPVRLNEVVEQALELVDYQFRRADVEIGCELAPDLPTIHGDPDQLNQVVVNLLINAIQAMEEGRAARRVTLRTALLPANGEIELQVCDSGPGVPEELRRQIFDPFFTTKATGVGTGIGLSVCHGMISAHGGTISVDEAPGGGARFRVRLPCGPAAAGADGSGRVPAGARRGRVLVVDDEPEICEMVSEFLAAAGHSVDAVTTAEEALARLENVDYDVVVCDLRMPKMDGRALYEEIARRRPALLTRFVFATGDLLTDSSRRFLKESGRPCLEKPLLPEQVRRIVVQTVGETQATVS